MGSEPISLVRCRNCKQDNFTPATRGRPLPFCRTCKGVVVTEPKPSAHLDAVFSKELREAMRDKPSKDVEALDEAELQDAYEKLRQELDEDFPDVTGFGAVLGRHGEPDLSGDLS